MDESKFIGDKEISRVEPFEYKNKKFIDVFYQDGSKEIFGEEIYNLFLLKGKTSDYTMLRDGKGYIVVKDILEVLFKHNVKSSEVEYMLAMTVASINDNFDKSVEKLLGCSLNERNMVETDRILENKVIN